MEALVNSTNPKAFNGSIANNTGYSETNWTRFFATAIHQQYLHVSGVASMADVTEVKVYAYVADHKTMELLQLMM